MAGGRTVWWGKDSAWWRRERIVELGEEFGPAGPAVIDWLSCEAQAQNEGGVVKAGRRSIARGCFIAVDVVTAVLSRSVTLGLLEDFSDDAGLFTCRISGWKADQERARSAARKAKERAIEAEKSRSVTESHAEVATKPVNERAKALSPEDRASDDDKRLCGLLRQLGEAYNPKFKVGSRAKWLTDMRLLRERDGNSPGDIERAIRWLFTDSFWPTVVQSPGNLRKNFPQIWSKMNAPAAPTGRGPAPVESVDAFLARRAAR